MKIFSKVVAVITVLFCVANAFAGAWDYHGPKRDIVSLVVVANYEQPRLLAELIQNESRQPYLLIPANDRGDIYFCPPVKFGEVKKVDRKSFTRTISFIAPKQIIVLGDERYVPNYYVNALKKIAPVYVVDAETWQAAADSLAPMLNLSRLPNNYRKLSSDLTESKFYTPKRRLRRVVKRTQAVENENFSNDNNGITFDVEPELVEDESKSFSVNKSNDGESQVESLEGTKVENSENGKTTTNLKVSQKVSNDGSKVETEINEKTVEEVKTTTDNANAEVAPKEEETPVQVDQI